MSPEEYLCGICGNLDEEDEDGLCAECGADYWIEERRFFR